MSLLKYELDENVAIITMDAGENRFNYTFFDAFHKILDEIENDTQANVLVVKSSDEKIWSNGIDLNWILSLVEKDGDSVWEKFSNEMARFLHRIVTYPMITFAAITGHAFAGGGILACAFDFRYMRNDRGWLCFPEVDIKIPFTPFLNTVVEKAIPNYMLTDMQLTARRLTAQECVEHHIVKQACSLDELMPAILEQAKTLNKDRNTLKTLKERLFKNVTAALSN